MSTPSLKDMVDAARPAGLPSANPTRSFWTHSSPDANPLASQGSEGLLTADADVCIIGSGITGVGVAYHLAQAAHEIAHASARDGPLKVVILEARDFLCQVQELPKRGTSSCCYLYWYAAREAAFGRAEAMRAYEVEAYTTRSIVSTIQEFGWADDVDLVNGGHMRVYFTEEAACDAKKDLECATSSSLDMEATQWVEKEEMQTEFGPPYPGVYSSAYNIWPLNTSRSLCTLGTPATAIEQVALPSDVQSLIRPYIVSTPRGTISCSRVIHATNGYASHLLPFLAGRIVPTRGQVMATRAAVSMDQIKTYAWGDDGGSEYWFPRPVPKGSDEKPLVILGGARRLAIAPFELNVQDDSVVCDVIGKSLRNFLPSVFPGKFDSGREPEMEWTGIMGFTDAGDPLVGPVIGPDGNVDTFKGQFIAAGYCGHGMPRAFGCAEIISQMIAAELSGKEWTRPEWMPERFLTWNRIDDLK
ncbi:FAD dependent oxidoreductase [Suillus clintonianus]|uniref:FAD dependent oxidoreductase n=1 Tax=Suillus clintonianus TaxID=1904413 RepID=UPI001B87A033|nr:FAD dependent oxidoreductase [Suillus clintonianus]KAG2141859.1 FAD dependent oxidoreductase [Suillus clintonianus]